MRSLFPVRNPTRAMLCLIEIIELAKRKVVLDTKLVKSLTSKQIRAFFFSSHSAFPEEPLALCSITDDAFVMQCSCRAAYRKLIDVSAYTAAGASENAASSSSLIHTAISTAAEVTVRSFHRSVVSLFRQLPWGLAEM